MTIAVPQNYDFGGWATKHNVKCGDGRIIRPNAFEINDGTTVPLVWQHLHDEPANVIGHATLFNRDEGVYAYGFLNESAAGQNTKLLVRNKDVESLSIYANDLVQKGLEVFHGIIREVSVVLSGMNPGAKIDNINIVHSSGGNTVLDDEVVIFMGDPLDYPVIEHSADASAAKKDETPAEDKTVGDVLATLTEEQRNVVYALMSNLSEALTTEDNAVTHSSEGESLIMKTNVFEGKKAAGSNPALTSAQFSAIQADAIAHGSLRASFLSHAVTYGIENIDYLFPDAQALTNSPEMISRKMEWVASIMGGTKHVPFARIKTTAADITADDARARGYVKGAKKNDEIVRLLRRITNPTTVYKHQKLDRDDVIDITDLDIVAWLKAEMRLMLDEEFARAILVGDGRAAESADKIDPTCIRPVWTDDDLYCIKVALESDTTYAEVADEMIRARIDYRGSGGPTLYAGPTIITEMLLIKDTTGRRIYNNLAELASTLRVSEIVEVPVMDNLTRETDDLVPVTMKLLGIIMNPRDYTVGADRGGQTSFFDDFDLDYNQMKYLLEARASGALTRPASAIAIEIEVVEAPGG